MLPRKMEVVAQSCSGSSITFTSKPPLPAEDTLTAPKDHRTVFRQTHESPSGTGKSVTEPSWWLGGFHRKPAVAALHLLMIAKTCSD